jgi:hypothetical protein
MKRCILTGILLFVLCSHAHGAAVRELNLEGLCRSAGTIVWGVCTGVETQDAALVYTFAARRMLKGGSADTVTLRMHKAASLHARAPRFAEGQEVLLFVYPESELGYSSPVGFGQGVFMVSNLSGGAATVANERGNSRLFKGMNMEKFCPGSTFPGIRQCSLANGGPLRHQEFLEFIAVLVAGRQVQP